MGTSTRLLAMTIIRTGVRSKGGIEMHRRVALIACSIVQLTGCSLLSPGYSLSPLVRESADQYSQVMDEFSDRVLLANVLRARDNAPLNFNDLTTLNGSFSASASMGLTVPFGPFTGPHTSYPYTASPTLMGSSSPTLTMQTLNTQGFILTTIQPISPTYVLSKWNAGFDHELLLYLFVKSIKFCDDRDRNSDVPNCRDSLEDALDYTVKAAAEHPEDDADDNDGGAAAFEAQLQRIHAAKVAIHLALRNAKSDPVSTVLTGASVKIDHAYKQAGTALSEEDSAAVRPELKDAAAEIRSAIDIRGSSSSCGHLSMTRIHLNNPDDKEEMEDFRSLVNCLADKNTRDGGDVDIKALMILDPLGNPLPFGETVSVQTPGPASPAPSSPNNQN